jgi:hypothetical protein
VVTPNGAEGRNPAQDRKLTPGDIRRLKEHGIDPEEVKEHNAGTDLFKDRLGNVYVKPRDGKGVGERTGINLRSLG